MYINTNAISAKVKPTMSSDLFNLNRADFLFDGFDKGLDQFVYGIQFILELIEPFTLTRIKSFHLSLE